MRFTRALILTSFALLSIHPVQAQWAVFDAKSWIQLQQMYTTANDTRDQIVQSYNLEYQMASLPQDLYSGYQQQLTAWTNWQNLSAGNAYGNTGGWINAANTGTGAAAGYTAASIQNSQYPQNSYGSLDDASQRIIASQYATTQLNDGIAESNLATLGSIRANAETQAQAIQQLQAATASADPNQHTEMSTLQRINLATLLQLQAQQQANQVAAAAALQQMLIQKRQNDAVKQAFQDAATYQQNYQTTMGPPTSGLTNTLNQSH